MFSVHFTSTPPSSNARLRALAQQISFPRQPSIPVRPLFLYICFPTSSFLVYSSLKRKDRTDDPLTSSTNPLPPNTAAPQEEEYEAGRVICQVCGVGIAFRDEATNEFTMKHWDAHRLAWYYYHLILLVVITNPHLTKLFIICPQVWPRRDRHLHP